MFGVRILLKGIEEHESGVGDLDTSLRAGVFRESSCHDWYLL